MMSPFESLQPARPRRLRSSATLKTPEPSAPDQVRAPSPPRSKLRLRRRAASQQISAPTQQFLASVASADVPIPSIEEPQLYSDHRDGDGHDDQDMLSISYPVIPSLGRIGDVSLTAFADRDRSHPPPKTPVPPELEQLLSPRQFPDWSLGANLSSAESSPDDEGSRPSTAVSTQTSSSLFSRLSMVSEESSLYASSGSENKQYHESEVEDEQRTPKPVVATRRSAKSRRPLWTQAMNRHLWATYMTYLQDPRVTPFRVGKSGIPPRGVCLRVAREAKRSWRGSQSLNSLEHQSRGFGPSPARSASPYIEWPHTCAATRGHLRELCRAHNSAATRPAPAGKTGYGFWARRSAQSATPSVFSGNDMAMSLSVATSESMQPQGPLARLTASSLKVTGSGTTPPTEQPQFNFGSNPEQPKIRLGSPFTARGLQSNFSSSLGSSAIDNPDLKPHAHTVGFRRSLGSPLKLDQSRQSSQKRRSAHSMFEPRRIKRPSLGPDFWTDPSPRDEKLRSTGQRIEFSSTDSSRRDNLFVPRTNLQELFEAPHCTQGLTSSATFPIANSSSSVSASTSAQNVPAGLGSPFSARGTRHTLPNRHTSAASVDLGAVFRPFATMHRTGEETRAARDISPTPVRPTKRSLVDSLAYIDERLKDFRRRDRERRRSWSPF